MALKLTCQEEKGLGAGCTYSARYYKNKGQLHFSNPQPGDQVFFSKDSGKSYYHTGIVEKVENGKVYTIEGNASNKVRNLSYNLTDSKLHAYGRPNYSLIVESEPTIIEPAKKFNPTKSGTIYNAPAVNVRIGPGTNHDKIGVINDGSAITILGTDSSGKWYNFTSDNYKTAWINALYVQVKVIPTTTNKSAKVTAVLGLNVRSGPGTTYKKIGALIYGAVVNIIDTDSTKKWYKIKTQKYTGWANSTYLKIISTTSIVVKKTATGNLRIREGRGTKYKQIGLIPKGTTVEVSDLSSGWYKVKYNNIIGYSHSQYLK